LESPRKRASFWPRTGQKVMDRDSFQYDLATGIALKKELLGFDSALCGYLLI